MGRLFTKEKLKNCCLSLLLAALVAAAGGCGGGSDGTAREKLYVAGELHGGLADALYTLACCAPYGGQTGRAAPHFIRGRRGHRRPDRGRRAPRIRSGLRPSA